MNRILGIGLLVLLLMVFQGVVQASEALDPCGLLTTQEMEALVGEPVSEPEQRDAKNPLGQRMCLYSTVSSSRLIQISVIRTADMAQGIRDHGQNAVKVYTTTKEMLNPAEDVPGVGDDACWGTGGLHILKGEVYLLVAVGNTGKRENLDLARRIAGKIMLRL